MIYLKFNENGKVLTRHYKPFDEKHGLRKKGEELESEGILVESIPEPQEIEGKTPVLYYSEIEGLYYQYEDTQLSESEQLRADVDQLIIDSLSI